jgi:hypothetical protein
MKTNIFSSLALLFAVPLLAAESSPQAEVKAAVAALAGQTNYSWKTTVEVPADARFRPGPTEGRTEKGGYTLLSLSFRDNVTEAVLKGTNGALKTPDSGWQSLAEAAQDDGGGPNPGMFLARMLQSFKAPAVQAAELADQAREMKKGTNGISGELPEEAARTLLTFRPRGRAGGGEGPAVSNAKGSVKFWIADGRLSRYQFHVQGTVSFNGNDRDVDRTTTVEIKDVNTTRIDVPDEAKGKL